jgi:trehalose 2-sulfotransferase
MDVLEDGIFARPHGEMDREAYLDLVSRLGTTPNGVFGAKLMWNNVPHVLDKLWELPRFAGPDRAATFRTLFPDLHVIRLTRRDRVAQAVSWARAAQDGVWVVSDTDAAAPVREPVYSYDLIARLEGLLIEGEHGWPELCAELGVAPLEVVYEDLVDTATYSDTIRSALDHLGIDHTDVAIAPPRTTDRPTRSTMIRAPLACGSRACCDEFSTRRPSMSGAAVVARTGAAT